MKGTIRALGVFSGGLDSMLAARVLTEQGVEVELLTFVTPFFGPERARKSAAILGLPLREMDITEKYYPLLFTPRYGFGKGHNPCIDCHILMLREAAAVMQAEGFHFLFTGEVLGQRPMSQNRQALELVAKGSGVPELVLRPLSAQLLPPTLPEREGWVDRERLLNLSGRGRKRQMELAEKYGLRDYPSPAGGCLLTDPGYAARLKELLAHQAQVARQDLELLKWGRHFRLPAGPKAVVGRTRRENEAITGLVRPGDLMLKVLGVPGPVVLIPGGGAGEAVAQAARLAAAYSDARPGTPVTVLAEGANKPRRLSLITPEKAELADWLI